MTGTQKSAGKKFSIVFTVALICLMAAAIIPGVMGASTVNLGTAGNYVILAKSGITTTGTTMITGNIGVSPIAAGAITGFGLIKDSSNQFATSSLVVGRVYAADYASPTPSLLTTAVSNMETAYTDAAGRAGPDATELYAGNLGGRTLAPGLYKWSTGVLIPASTALTLDAKGNGDAVWIFQVSGDLTMNSASQVVLINGAKAENIYWQIGGGTGVTLEAGAHAEGTILAAKAITMKSGASLHGRALAQTAVTLIANTITAPIPAPAQTAAPTTVQTVATTPASAGTTPAQTAATTPAQTTATTTMAPTGAASTTITVNVGGNSGVYQAAVTGTGNTGLTVTGTTASGPGQGIPQPSGTVYRYLDLAPAHYTTIDRAVISFTVPVSWLDDHNIAPQNVVLQHLDGNMWNSLPTTLGQTAGGQVYFTAVSSGFGQRFAITGQFTPAATTVQTTVSTVAQTSQPTSLPTTKTPVPVWVPVTAVIGALLIMAVLSGRSGKNS